MYERFTDRSRKVMMLANQEAERLGSPSLAPEHILFGLLKEGSGVAAHVLRNLDVSIEAVMLSLETGATPTPPAPAHQSPPDRPWWWLLSSAGRRSMPAGRLPRSPESNALIDQSFREARALNHNYVGTEHLLLALVAQPNCRAADLLVDQGLRLDDVRQDILDLLGHGT